MYLILGHAFFNQLLHCWFSIVSGDNIDPVSLLCASSAGPKRPGKLGPDLEIEILFVLNAYQ